VAMEYEQSHKRLREALQQHEGRGNGEFTELEELHVFWSHKANFHFEGKHIDNESCVASLIKSEATGREYVIPKGDFKPLSKKDLKRSISHTAAMLSDLKRIHERISKSSSSSKKKKAPKSS
jgi:hypothetical protein